MSMQIGKAPPIALKEMTRGRANEAGGAAYSAMMQTIPRLPQVEAG